VREIDGVLNDVHLVLQRRSDIHRCVGDDECLLQRGHVHDEAVADAPVGPQPGVAFDDRAHQFVGVETALHERLHLALSRKRDGPFGRRLAMRSVYDRDAGQVESAVRGHGSDPLLWTDQNRDDQPCLGCFDCPTQRAFVAGMCDRAWHRLERPRPCDQSLILFMLLFHVVGPLNNAPW
jgi:hypothetical protein